MIIIFFVRNSVIIENDVTKKIKNIRTQYKRERRKIVDRKTGEGADEVYVSKWPPYNSLRFLDDIDVLPKPSILNLEVSKFHACMGT